MKDITFREIFVINIIVVKSIKNIKKNQRQHLQNKH